MVKIRLAKTNADEGEFSRFFFLKFRGQEERFSQLCYPFCQFILIWLAKEFDMQTPAFAFSFKEWHLFSTEPHFAGKWI